MAVNLRAPFLLARALAPAMIAQKRGKIINVSSQAGVVDSMRMVPIARRKAGSTC